jgi:uncharacterized protein YndB with AHSA1/START domain
MSSQNDTVAIEDRFNASVENVWRTWTDSKIILKWFDLIQKANASVLRLIYNQIVL